MIELSDREVKLLKKSWEPISAHLIDYGDEILSRFFEVHPEHLQSFSKFSALPKEDLKGRATFRTHASFIMNHISTAIDSLGREDGEEEIHEDWLRLGQYHQTKRITRQQFLHFRDVLISFILHISDSATILLPDLKHTWLNFFHLIYDAAFQELEAPLWSDYFSQ